MNVLYSQIMLIGLVAGVAATYSAITDLATNKFTVPCYVDPDRATKQLDISCKLWKVENEKLELDKVVIEYVMWCFSLEQRKMLYTYIIVMKRSI